MPKSIITFFIAALLGLSAFAQDEPADATDDAPDQALEEGVADTDEDEENDSDLDDQTYEDDEDDFIPTEEIPADEPIPFPTNI